nr:zinc finger, CCHC-type [Tanacetum cinerariifolium]
MHFLLSSMSMVYVLTTFMPDDGGENPSVKQVRRRAKWDNDNYVCRGLILNGMSDSLFDVYQNVGTSKELWDTLEAKYMAEDDSSMKFLVSNFTNYKMIDSRSVLKQYNELLGILGRFTQHKMNIDESIQVSCIIDKLSPSWKDFKNTLKHLKEELTLIELGSHLRIEESLRVQDSDKPKGNNVAGLSVVNMVEHNNSSKYNDNKGTKGSKDGSSNRLKGQKMFNKSLQIYYVTHVSEAYFVQDDDITWWVDSEAAVHVCKDRCWFKTYESLNDVSILHMGNESTALVHGRSCVDLKFSSGKVVSLLNVLYAPNIRKNLVSSSILNNYGINKLNIVSDNIGSTFMSISKLNDLILWHARLGHVHFKRIQDMSKYGLIPAFNLDTEKCNTCMLTKITKKPFQNVKRITKVLELIHNDLCDLYATPLLGNKKHFVTFIDDASRFCYVYLLHTKDKALDKFKVFKTEVDLQQGSLIKRFRTDMGDEYTDTLYFQSVVAINSIIESRDGIFDEHKFSSVPRPSQRSLKDETKNSSGSVVSERVIEEVVQQPKSELRKSKRHRTLKDFGPEFQLYLIEGTMYEISDQHSYCFNVEDDLKTFDEAMKSRDVASRNKQLMMKWTSSWAITLGGKNKYHQTTDCYGIYSQSDYSSDGCEDSFLEWGTKIGALYKPTSGLHPACNENKDIREVDVILGIRIKHESNVSTPLDTCEKLMPNKGPVVSQLEYSRVIGCLMYAMTCTRPDITFDVGKLSRLVYSGYPSVLEGYTDASWTSNTEDNSSTSGWVLLLGGGVIFWASKKQTCITGSIIESEFVALTAAGKEAEWLKNLFHKISLWVKPIAPISIRCDSATTLAKAYIQIYNGKSRYLGVRHSMIRELITNGVVSIEFVRSQQNLADHLTKGLARDLVIKSAEGMRLKSN